MKSLYTEDTEDTEEIQGLTTQDTKDTKDRLVILAYASIQFQMDSGVRRNDGEAAIVRSSASSVLML